MAPAGNRPRVKRHRRSTRWLAWLAYAAGLSVVFVLTAYFAFSFFVRSGVIAVPDLHGASLGDAQALVSDAGLRLEWSEDARYDESVPAGHVIRQRPRAGSLVKRGTLVRATASLGQEVVEVPDVSGRALQAAQVTLASQGLSLGKVGNVFSTTEKPGTVVNQDPVVGTNVSRGQAVDLYLSLDSKGAIFVMPDLVYRRYTDVRRYFESKDMRLGSIKFEAYEGIAPGVILRQYPQPGHPLRRFDVISLVVTQDEVSG